MATELGKAYVQIVPSAKGISGAIKNAIGPEAESAGESAGASIGSKLVKAVTGVIAAAGIGKLFSASLMEGADLEQSIGGVKTLFKASADTVQQYANEAYRTTGLSANAYMESVTGFSASLLQSLGGDTAKSAEVAHMAMVDMSDNANKMGTDMGLIQNAYQGFAKQNYTMLDNLKLGYGGTKSEMERLLADAEKISGVKYDINNLSDVYSAIHEIQKDLEITGATADEAATTFSGSFAAMKAAAQNVLGNLSLGADIEPSLVALAQTTSTFLFSNFFPMVGNILKGLPQAFAVAFETAGPILLSGGQQMLEQLGIGFDSGMAGFGAKVMTTIQPVIEGFQTAFGQLPGLFQTIASSVTPVIETIANGFTQLDFSGIQNLISAIIPALEAGFSRFMSIAGPAIDSVVQSFVGLWNAAQPLISILADALMPAFEILGSFLGGVFQGIMIGISGLFDGLKIAIEILTPVVSFLVDVLKFFEPVFSAIAQGVGVAIGLFTNLGSVGEGLGSILKSAWSNIQSAVQTAGNIIRTAIEYIKLAFSGAGNAVGVLKNVFSLAWMAIQDAINVAKGIISGAISTVKSAFSSFGSLVSSVGGSIRGVIDNITGVIKGLANIDISGAGAAIMNGFLGGLKSAWGAVTDFVGGIAGWIAEHKGPISYDKRLLIPAGKAIMGGLNQGLVANFREVQSTVSGMAGALVDSFGDDGLEASLTSDVRQTLTNDSLLNHSTGDSSQSGLLDRLASVETLLQGILDKDLSVYLDGEKIGQSTYRTHGHILAREGM
ncbi:minor tail protein [Streptococcus phage Javan290]|uniref:phage tail protein n=1 Tax=Streptococcus marmotae TaxID=1825069 RepID=UPI0008299C0E|nr:phage tail protein [Streptococcus marmotae]QBX26072.1 minor tail protein [Streptococcus phage Javan290]